MLRGECGTWKSITSAYTWKHWDINSIVHAVRHAKELLAQLPKPDGDCIVCTDEAWGHLKKLVPDTEYRGIQQYIPDRLGGLPVYTRITRQSVYNLANDLIDQGRRPIIVL